MPHQLPEYLGDSIYVQDGSPWSGEPSLLLTTDSHLLEDEYNQIFLNAEVIRNLLDYIQRKKKENHNAPRHKR